MRISLPTESELEGSSLGKDAWSRLRKNKLAMISMCFIGFMLIICFIVAPLPLLMIQMSKTLQIVSCVPSRITLWVPTSWEGSIF